MKLVRWDPLHEFVALSNRLNRTINDPLTQRTEDSYGAWAPPVDIFERQDHLVIRAEVPGIQKEDMDVRIENGVLTLHGERREEKESKDVNAHLTERVYGSFTRSFSLPTTVDAAKVTAIYKDGVLEVTVPKVETAKPKRIEIKVA
jgi:HSP20 family protein